MRPFRSIAGVAFAAAVFVAALALGAPAFAQEAAEPALPQPGFSFHGPFGSFDRAAAQRGFLVYQQVCSNCHSLRQLYYRNLEGIGFSPEQVKAIAASVKVPGGVNENGEAFERVGRPSDHFRSPYPNDQAARAANGGALPPDQSVLELAREGGANYLYGVLVGYGNPPAGMKIQPGLYYNTYFPGHQIAMPPPLQDGSVTYTDGTKPTINQEAYDVVTFLAWAANPEMETRKQTGVKVVLFLIFLTGLTYAVKRKIWSDVH